MPLPILFAIGSLLARFYRALRAAWREPASRGLIYSVVVLIAIGAIVYRAVEGWSWVDSLYFTIITLTTVGYGDFAPQTVFGKLFIVIYILLGLGLLASFIGLIASHAQADMQERHEKRQSKRGLHHAHEQDNTTNQIEETE